MAEIYHAAKMKNKSLVGATGNVVGVMGDVVDVMGDVEGCDG